MVSCDDRYKVAGTAVGAEAAEEGGDSFFFINDSA
jgi:hypothetical protein